MRFVSLVGSRSLGASGVPLVGRVVASLLGRGFGLAVGCARGADAAVLFSVLLRGQASRLSVFAVGGEAGEGFAAGAAVDLVRRAAASGASVSWWAGGPASVPLSARLVRRSRACVAAGGAGCVAFLAPGASPGSVGSLRAAAALGVPCVCFCVGRAGAPPAVGAGRWVLGAGAGVWASAWRWVPAVPAAGGGECVSCGGAFGLAVCQACGSFRPGARLVCPSPRVGGFGAGGWA